MRLRNYLVRTKEGVPLEVMGYPVFFDGLSNYGWVVHRQADRKTRWSVSELSTGAAVCQQCCTRTAAIKAAQAILSQVGEDRLRKHVFWMIFRFGELTQPPGSQAGNKNAGEVRQTEEQRGIRECLPDAWL